MHTNTTKKSELYSEASRCMLESTEVTSVPWYMNSFQSDPEVRMNSVTSACTTLL